LIILIILRICTCYEAPHYVVFFNLQSLHLALIQIFSFLNVRDQVSHPYRTTGKSIVLYIRISTFLDSRQEDKGFWTEW
jgi:hypothetical protein